MILICVCDVLKFVLCKAKTMSCKRKIIRDFGEIKWKFRRNLQTFWCLKHNKGATLCKFFKVRFWRHKKHVARLIQKHSGVQARWAQTINYWIILSHCIPSFGNFMAYTVFQDYIEMTAKLWIKISTMKEENIMV